MITKVLLVTIFILLSWNSFQQSKNLELLKTQGLELQLTQETIEGNTKQTQSLLNNYSDILKSQPKHSDELQQLSQTLMSLNDQFSESTSRANTSLKNQLSGIENRVKAPLLKEIKQLQTKFETSHKATLDTVKETRKLSYRAFDQLKALSNKVSLHSANSHTTKKYIEKTSIVSKASNTPKNTYIKPSPIKTNLTNKSNPFYDIAQALHKTKDSHINKKMEAASKHLSKLKSEVWKSRKVENIPRKEVMSILSSIDIVKSKWDKKENTYQLDSLEKKIIQLFYKLGITK